MAEAVARSLEGFELFRSLAPPVRAELERQCRWRRCQPPEPIIDRLDPGRDVYFIVGGRVRVVNYSLSGREVSFIDLDPGSFFGELAAIDNAPRTASVVPLVPTLVAAMPATVFCRVVSEHPAVALATMTHLTGMIRRSVERIMELSTLGANNRVHAELLRLARAGRIQGNTAVIAPIPVHSDIASRVSTTRETVARVFGELTRSGLVERRVDHLLVRDLGRMARMVEEVRGED